MVLLSFFFFLICIWGRDGSDPFPCRGKEDTWVSRGTCAESGFCGSRRKALLLWGAGVRGSVLLCAHRPSWIFEEHTEMSITMYTWVCREGWEIALEFFRSTDLSLSGATGIGGWPFCLPGTSLGLVQHVFPHFGKAGPLFTKDIGFRLCDCNWCVFSLDHWVMLCSSLLLAPLLGRAGGQPPVT